MSPRLLVVAAMIAALLPGAASAQGKKKRPVAKAAPATIDEATFGEFFAGVAEEAGRSFLNKEDLPDASILDPMANELKKGADKAKSRTARLKQVIDGAQCVQRGQNGLPADIYELMVRQSADGLEVGAIVEADFAPNTRAGRSLTKEEKALSAACQAEARNEPANRRAKFQQCLGRRRSAEIYPADYLATVDLTKVRADLACVTLIEEIENERKKAAPVGVVSQPAELDTRLREARESFGSGRSAMLQDMVQGAIAPSRTLGLDQKRRPASYGVVPTDPIKLTKDLNLTAPPLALGNVDLTKSAQLARTAKNNEIGFTGMCYSYVKAALQAVGLATNAEIDASGMNAHAYLFADFVEKHQALKNRKLKKIPNPKWPLPIGTVVVWAQGACGYSAASGHIEIVTRIKPPQACSDGCGTFQVACLDELTDKAIANESKAAQLETEVSEAQAAYDAKKTKANRSALAAKRAELNKVKPRVSAYAVEKEPSAVASN